MEWILGVGGVFIIVLLCWVIVNGKSTAKLVATSVALVIAFLFGNAMGTSWERLRNYDRYVYSLSQYSKQLRAFAEHQQITDLTNAVIMFDKRFNADPRDIQDAVFQILKVNRYYRGTNLTTLPATTNEAGLGSEAR